MKMVSATRVAALALGLSLAGGQGFAAPSSEDRGHRNTEKATPDRQDRNDRKERDQRAPKPQPPAAGQQDLPVNPIVQPSARNDGRQDRQPRARTERRQDRQTGARNAERRDRQPGARNEERRDRNAVQPREQRRVGDDRRGREDRADRRRNDVPKWRTNDRDRDWGGNRRSRDVDVRHYRRNFHAPRRFHAGRYRQPYGYSYRRYTFGQNLPFQYYRRDYWLTNFLVFGLFSPPPGYVWVRYGPDALLIDEYTGEIVQVRYNMFYS